MMSIIGSISPAQECQSCGTEYGGNVLYIGNVDFRNSHNPNVAYTGGRHGRIYACDLCVWGALDAYFGDLVPKDEHRPLFR